MGRRKQRREDGVEEKVKGEMWEKVLGRTRQWRK